MVDSLCGRTRPSLDFFRMISDRVSRYLVCHIPGTRSIRYVSSGQRKLIPGISYNTWYSSSYVTDGRQGRTLPPSAVLSPSPSPLTELLIALYHTGKCIIYTPHTAAADCTGMYWYLIFRTPHFLLAWCFRRRTDSWKASSPHNLSHMSYSYY